ncbi:MAG: DNA repair protein RecO [Pseudomonadales bacterium]|nr:DNA repair protein RecO [Pseudomonadales bacterium]
MTSRIELQPAYVIHTQPFQNSSLLVDIFTLDFGRIKAVAKGARKPGSKSRSRLQPFQPLLVSLLGRNELKTLIGAEISTPLPLLTGMKLFSGLYINELLVRMLQFNESHQALYQAYQQALLQFHGDWSLQTILRRFELQLLEELGYGIDLYHDCLSQAEIIAEAQYLFHPESGLEQLPSGLKQHPLEIYRGHEIIALRELRLDDKGASLAAKRLLRAALEPHLGNKPLSSRRLFRES